MLLTLFAAVAVPLTIGRHFRFASLSLGMASASATFIASLLALMAVTGDYM